MKLLLDTSDFPQPPSSMKVMEMLAESESPAPSTVTSPDHELIIITALCSTLISVTGLIMAAMLCSWCFGRKKYDSDEEESLNEYKPVAYGGEDSSSIRDSSIAGTTPNQSPSHNGSAQCNSSSTQHLTSVGNKKSSKLFRFDRHHGDKHKIVTEPVQPPTNTNQVAHMVTEETVAFTQQKRRPSKEMERKQQQNERRPSIPLEILNLTTTKGITSEDDCQKSNERKDSTASVKSFSDKAYNIFGLNERKKSKPCVIEEELPCTSSQIPPTKGARKNSQTGEANNVKSKLMHCPLPYKSSWNRIKSKLPLIIAQKKTKADPPKRRISMFATREDFLRRFSSSHPLQERKPSPDQQKDSKNKNILRRFSLGSQTTVREVAPPDSSTQVHNVQQLVSMFKEKIQEEANKPTRQIRKNSKIQVKQLKRKSVEQDKLKQSSNSPYYSKTRKSSKDATPSNADQNVAPDNTDQDAVPEKTALRVPSGIRRCSRIMTEEEKHKAYVNLIKRRREVEQMRKQYMQRTGSSVEVDRYECDPPIPADVAL